MEHWFVFLCVLIYKLFVTRHELSIESIQYEPVLVAQTTTTTTTTSTAKPVTTTAAGIQTGHAGNRSYKIININSYCEADHSS